MNFLLDTCTFIWSVGDDGRLGRVAAAKLSQGMGLVYVSVATAWEIAIKFALGRLEFDPGRFAHMCQTSGFLVLPIKLDHAIRAGALPPIHKDPFDRILVAQAQHEGLTLVTADATLVRYSVPVLRADA